MPEQEQKDIPVRFNWYPRTHTKILGIQGRLVAKKGKKVTFEDTLIELLDEVDDKFIQKFLEKKSWPDPLLTLWSNPNIQHEELEVN